MKIAIKANSSRGEEIISLLESLGGINDNNWKGDGDLGDYYIDENNIIRYNYKPIDYKVYTLEEFEKEFPYKIGETVITTLNHVGTIIGIVNSKYKVLFKEDSALVAPRRLKLYKEMKKERNITLTLDKAKEWYKKGGELREIALQAFKESELNPLPRSWEEYTDKMALIRVSTDKLPLSSLPKKYIALYKLEQLRDCWIQGWKPNWLEGNVQKYVIQKWRDKISIETTYVTHSFLSFPTYEMAKEFLKCFRDLIENAEDLI